MSASELVDCPHCNGRGGSTGIGCGPGGCKLVSLVCGMCTGGKVQAEELPALLVAIERGRSMRDERVARGLSLREEAKRRGVTVLRLSHEERGRVMP